MILKYKIWNFRIFLLALTLFSFNSVQAQILPGGVSPEESKDKEERRESGTVASFGLKGANMLNDWGVELGVDIIGRINENFGIGGCIYYLMTQNLKAPTYYKLTNPHIKLFYFGIDLDYTIMFSKSLGVSLTSLIALGQMNINDRPDVDISGSTTDDWFFLVEPSISLIYRFFGNLGVAVSAGYRRSLGVDRFGLNNDELSGMVLKLSLCSFM